MTARKGLAMRPAPAPVRDEDWRTFAACFGHPLADDLWFAHTSDHVGRNEAKAICKTECHVRAQCLAFALATREAHGVWGGLDEDERRDEARRQSQRRRNARRRAKEIPA